MINFAVQLKYRSLFKHIVLAVMGLFGASVLLFLTNRYGAGLTPDSVGYISVARNFAEGNGFLTFNGTPLIIQPPLYPIMLSLIKRTFLIDPLISAGYLNAALFGLIIYLSGMFFAQHLKSFILVICGTAAVMASFAIVQSSLMALSEPLFILLVLLFLFSFEKYKLKKDYPSLIILSMWGALACLTRYTGVAVILTGAVCMLLQNKKENANKYYHSIVFLLIAGLPIGIWVIRNYLLSGTFADHRGTSLYTLNDNFQLLYNTVVSWYLPMNSKTIYVVIMMILLAVWIIFSIRNAKDFAAEAFRLIGPGLLFTVLYSGTIIITSTTTAYDKISDRLLSPIFIPLLLIFLFAADRMLVWFKKYFDHQGSAILFGLLFIIFIRYPAKNTIHFMDDYIKMSGWGYNCNAWQKSETIDYLLRGGHMGKISALYSNEPEAVYIFTNSKTSRSPLKTFYNSSQLYNIKQDEEYAWHNSANVYLVWFNKTDRNFLFSIEELKNNVKMTEVEHLEDGEIYLISKK